MKLFLYILLFIPLSAFSQSEYTDSLKRMVKVSKSDSLKSAALRELYYTYSMEGEYEKADPYIERAIAICKKSGDRYSLGKCYTDIGLVKRKQGIYSEALEYSQKALKIFEKLESTDGISINSNNIGIIYKEQKNYSDALKYFQKSLDCDIASGDAYGEALGYGNLAIVHTLTENFDEAYRNNFKSLAVFINIKDTMMISRAYNNIGGLFANLSEEGATIKNFTLFNIDQNSATDSSLYYKLKSLEVQGDAGFDYDRTFALVGVGFAYVKRSEPQKGLKYCEEALRISDRMNSPERSLDACNCLQMIWAETGNYRKAYEYYLRYDAAKDSVINEDNIRDLTQREMNFGFEKKEFTDSLMRKQLEEKKNFEQEKKDAARNEELRLQKIYTFSGLGGLLLLGALAFVLYKGIKRKQEDNKIISEQKLKVEHQNELLEEKNKEILDSINYAKRLQDAILPPLRIVKEYLPDSFILYKPKDIVAGDFYFMEPTGEKIVFAAADCTGHGVPGAMVSVVCSNALNRVVKEFKITDAGKILDKVRELVLETFEKSESEVKDGMDISLCVLDLKNKMLHWSGANNPLWIVRKEEGQGARGEGEEASGIHLSPDPCPFSLIEFKPDKQPIGKYADSKPFHTHEVELLKNDAIYVFTDGYEDQFGGEKGKKYKSSRMKELFLSIQTLSMMEQKGKIDSAFEDWKSELEQVDDVCIIGVRV